MLKTKLLISTLLGCLNPWVATQTIAQAFWQWIVVARGVLTQSDHNVPEHVFSVPFRGRWVAINGGVKKDESHSWNLIAQRYAYDFVVPDQDGETHSGDGKSLADYYAYGQLISSPASGKVVEVRDDIADHQHPRSGWISWWTRDIRGNFVVIEHGPALYSVLAHLKHGSVMVKPGDTVQAGDPIGSCGNSGYSTEPHLHFQIQSGPSFWYSRGLPFRFGPIEIESDEESPEVTVMSWAHVNKGEYLRAVTEVSADCSAGEGCQSPPLSTRDLVVSTVLLGMTLIGYYAVIKRIVRIIIS